MRRWGVRIILLFVGCGLVPTGSLASPPIARIKESIIACPGDSVTVDGWASIDPGGEVISWLWDITGDGSVDTTTFGGELRIKVPSDPGTVTITLVVTDNEGNQSLPERKIVHVMKSAPIVSAGFDTTLKIGTRLMLEPRAKVACGRIVLYEWDFTEDGNFEYSSTGKGTTSKAYNRQGVFTATLRVTDSFGNRTVAVRTITVTGDHAGGEPTPAAPKKELRDEPSP